MDLLHWKYFQTGVKTRRDEGGVLKIHHHLREDIKNAAGTSSCVSDLYSIDDLQDLIDRFDRPETTDQKPSSESRSDHYYRAKNHGELFKLGQNYLEEFRRGRRIFGIASLSTCVESEKIAWGISTVFNLVEEQRVLIITEDFRESFYNKMDRGFEKCQLSVPRVDHQILGHVADGITVIETDELASIIKFFSHKELKDFFGNLSSTFGPILFSLPKRKQMIERRRTFVPIIESLSNITFAIRKKDDLRELRKYAAFFEKYDVPTLGAVFGTQDLN